MISIYFKYLCLIWSSVYITLKILNQKCTWKEGVILALASLLPAIIMVRLRQDVPAVSILAMVTASCGILYATCKVDAGIAVTATIIGYGISYLIFLIAAFACSFIEWASYDRGIELSVASTIFIGIVQFVLSFLLFRIKRLRRGFPFLSDSRYGDLGLYLSVMVLMAFSLLEPNPDSEAIPLIAVYLAICCGMILWFWWKKRMTKEYMEKLREREERELMAAISSRDNEIAVLKKENETFSKIIHKDNKLIPAMELAVKEALYAVVYNEDQNERVKQTEKILAQLENISKDRSGIVRNYEHKYTGLPQIGISVLDALFAFMMQKATGFGIRFQLRFDESVSEIIPRAVSEQDASTLLADLIENAIIATKENPKEKYVFAELGTKNSIFSISISDTGAPFSEKVLQNWGKQRITTHADNGGSGIGMMTTHDICEKYHASFLIEYFEDVAEYRKRVSVRFDGMTQFRVENQ